MNGYEKIASFENFTIIFDEFGGHTKQWNFLLTQPCSIRLLSGDEIRQDDKKTVIATHRLYTEYNPILSEKNRVIIDGVIFDIKIIDNKRDKFLQIDVKETK